MISNKEIYEQQQEILQELKAIRDDIQEIHSKLNDIDRKTLKPKLKDKLEVERW